MVGAAIFAILVGFNGTARAHHTQKLEDLKGLSAVSVLVQDLSDGAKVLGLNKDDIQTDVELKLRLAGMRVVTEEEGFKLPGDPYLYVNVTLPDTPRVASIAIELRQDAVLRRNSAIAHSVITWSSGAVISSPSAQIIRDDFKDLVDKFLNDWLSVNPKK